MALIINHNMTAQNAARNLGTIYDRLSTSVQRLSSGLRINSAADDAAGLAVREMMRADIATMNQGIRNTADAISMIQTADGALSIIDEKLTRMKELAEQASTGTYTTAQREIINSEYQAMAAEIDRIANATNFNGIKLLDGSVTNQHGGQGLKVHFGVSNKASEDYYFVNIGDARATSSTGLRIGGDAKNDIWGQGAAGSGPLAGPGCCTAGYSSLNGEAGFVSGETFTYGYNWSWQEDDDAKLLAGRYIAGRYTVNSSDSLQDLVNKVNAGSQSRVGVQLKADGIRAAVYSGGTVAVCVGDEAYVFGSAGVAGGLAAGAGPVYNYTAQGTYDAGGFVYNGAEGYGFGLTAAQVQRLQAAGVDLGPLGLQEARVAATGESTEGAEAAQKDLQAKLSQAWKALGLDKLQSLATDAGAVSGFSVTDAEILACAATGIVNGAGLAATIASGQTLRVHTGVFADENGNWTDNAQIASALGFDEVVFSFANDGTMRHTATLLNTQGTYSNENYIVNGSRTLAVHANEYGALEAAGIDLVAAGYAVTSVTGNFRGTGPTAASARADLVGQVQEAWDEEWGMVNNRLLYSAADDSAAALIMTVAQMEAAQAVLGTGATVDTGTGIIQDTGAFIVHTGIYKQVGASGNWTSSLAIAQEMCAIGIAFEEVVYTIESDGSDYTISMTGGTFTAGGGLTATMAAFDIGATAPPGNLATRIGANLENYLNSQTGYGRLRLAPNTGPTALFGPTAAEINNSLISTVDSGIPSYLTVTADVAGETVELNTGRISQLDRNTTNLGTLINQTGKALSNVLAAAQRAASAPGTGLTGMGRIVARAATPTAGPTSIAQVEDLAETRRFVTGALERSVATGGYAFSGYSFSESAGIGITSAQLRALTRAGVDLSRLHLANPSVSASASSTAGSASARQLLADRLNQLWNDFNLDELSALTVASGATTGYTPLTGTKVMASAAGALSGATASQATVAQGGSFVIHTGIYADRNGNWTDEAAIASALGLQEVTYQVTNERRTWVKMSADIVSSAYASGNLVITSAVWDLLETEGYTAAAVLNGNQFTNPTVRAVGSAHSEEAASSQLYLDGLAKWGAKYGGDFHSIEFDAGNNATGLADFSHTVINTSASAGNTTGSGATDIVASGKTLRVHTGIYVDIAAGTVGNWTDDSAIANLLGMVEIYYDVTNNADGDEYTYARNGDPAPMAYMADDVLTLEELGEVLAQDTRALIGALQGVSTSKGRVYRGASGPLVPPSAQTVAAGILDSSDPLNYSESTGNNGITNLSVSFNLAGQNYTGLSPYASPLSLNADTTTMNQLAIAINGQLGGVISGLQTIANTAGLNGVGRIVNALNSPPVGVIAVSDLTSLSVEDIYLQGDGGRSGIVDNTRQIVMVASAGTASADARGVSNFGARALASAINHNAASQFWAMVQSVDSNGKQADMVYVFAKEGGNLNSLLACDVAGSDRASREGLDSVLFENAETARTNQSGTTFSLGGEKWGTMKPTQTKASLGTEVWNVTIEGRDVGKERDIWIANEGQLDTPALGAGIINGMNRDSFVEIQNAANADWAGGEIRTQSTAQEALDAITAAITAKDKIRADLGALQNRLENTMTNLTIQAENLQASESRISDVDVATEMTEFTRNNVLSQAATSMLAQANSLSQLALSLIR